MAHLHVLILRTQVALLRLLVRLVGSIRQMLRHEAGQTSAEYALVLLGAGAIALLMVAWATQTNKVGQLLDAVFGQLLRHVKG